MPTKAELVEYQKRVEEANRKKKILKEQVYPGIIKASTSIDDAKFFLTSLSSLMMESFLAEMKERKFKDLNLLNKLDKADKQYEDYKQFLSIFEEMNVFEAREFVEGVKNEIDLFINDEMKERKLETLKTNFL